VNQAAINTALVSVFSLMIPEIILGGAACILFLVATFRSNRHVCATLALVGLLAALGVLASSPAVAPNAAELYASPLVLDHLAWLIKAIALIGGVVLVLFSWDAVPDRQAGEYYACLLLIIAGLCLTGAANELVTLFLALEVISIPTYVLLYLPRYDNAAQEAAMKYFLLSIFSSALLLFGFSYLYGLAGTTNIPALLAALRDAGHAGLPRTALVALVLIVAGLGFRITAVPFHFYVPDVYQGTPTVAAALLAFIPKVAGFAALLRVLGFLWVDRTDTVGLALGEQVPMLFFILAIVTMFLGNVFGLLQDNLKRMLAYSSVAHAGYMLIGLATAPDLHGTHMAGGVDAILFYLVAYGAMTVGAFAVLGYLSTPQRPVEMVDDLAGVSRSHPGVSLLMALFLFSLIGMPLTAGFAGKFVLFFGALAVPPRPEHPWSFRILALLGVINAAIGAWFYLRVIAVMYLRNPIKSLEPTRSWPGLATLWICALVTLFFGFYPRALLDVSRRAAEAHSPELQARL
jgi:NADH-quinone oxidoreductase subunit N